MYIYYQFFISILALLSSLFDKKAKIVVSSILSIFVIIISGLRGSNIGADDLKYLEYFKQAIESKNIIEYFNDIYFERGFTFFIYLQSNLFGYEFVFLVISIFSVIIAIYANSILDRDNYILFSSCFFITGFFWVGFVHIRFGLAISIFFLSYAYLYRGDFYKSIFVFIFSVLIHNAILLLIPIYLIDRYNAKFNKINLSIILFGSIILKSIGFFKLLISNVISLGFLNSSYAALFESKYGNIVSMFQLGNLKFILIALIVLYSSKVYEKQCVFFIIYVSIMFVSSDVNIISSRLSSILMFIEPFVIYTILGKFKTTPFIKYIMVLLYCSSYGLYLTEIKNILPSYEFLSL